MMDNHTTVYTSTHNTNQSSLKHSLQSQSAGSNPKELCPTFKDRLKHCRKSITAATKYNCSIPLPAGKLKALGKMTSLDICFSEPQSPAHTYLNHPTTNFMELFKTIL